LGSAAQIKITDLDDENNSCLHYACREVEDNQALIALLIKEKLDVNAVNNDKQRPLEVRKIPLRNLNFAVH
jgi:ankyrin repeat protein